MGSKMSNIASFTVSYDGKALQNHAMDVRDLAPALLSIGQLFDEANRVLNGDKVSIKLQVKAQREGSFEIWFEAVQTICSQISGFLTGDFVTSALNLKELVLCGGIGLFTFIKKLRGRNPTKIINLKNNFVRIEFGEESFDIPLDLLRLYQDVAVRTVVEKVLKPLEEEGIDTFSIKEDKKEIEKIDKSEVPYFKLPYLEEEKILEIEHEAAYSIVSLAFKEDNKWRLHDGNSTIAVSIKDEDFLKKVNDNLISFAKGDILLCHVKTCQFRIKGELKTDYEVLKVKEHRLAARQIPLPIFEKEEDQSSNL